MSQSILRIKLLCRVKLPVWQRLLWGNVLHCDLTQRLCLDRILPERHH